MNVKHSLLKRRFRQVLVLVHSYGINPANHEVRLITHKTREQNHSTTVVR